jgi:hypothetical protein
LAKEVINVTVQDKTTLKGYFKNGEVPNEDNFADLIDSMGGENAGTVTSIATSAPITGGPITGTGTIGISAATTTDPGSMSALDKTKLDAISGTNTGDNAVNSLYSSLISNATHTGDVTGATALTIAAKAVTLAKMNDLAVNTIIGRITNSTGVPEALSAANVRTIIGTGSGNGLDADTLDLKHAADFVAKIGDTMSGQLILPDDGLKIGTSQLTIASGMMGINALSPVVARVQIEHLNSATFRGINTGTDSASVGGAAITLVHDSGAAISAADMRLGTLAFGGVNSTTHTIGGNTAAISAFSSETFAPGANGGYLRFDTTPVGSQTRLERMRIQPDGRVDILGDISISKLTGWNDPKETWTYASASTITVPTGAAAKYTIGDKIKLTQTTVKYFYVINVADTLLTVTGGSDYTVANAAITLNYFSHDATPVAFPPYFNWTPTYEGFSVNPPLNHCVFSIVGKLMTFAHDCSGDGTSSLTRLYVISPVSCSLTGRGVWSYATDNGAAVTTPGRLYMTPGTSTIQCIKDSGLALWTESGGKRCSFIIQFYI